MEEISAEELRLLLEFYRELGIKGLYVDAETGPGGTDEEDVMIQGETGSGHPACEIRVEETPVRRVKPGREEKSRALSDLKDSTIGNCTRCKLSQKRTNLVFGEGNPDCEVMFIGEGPGEDEDIQGRPFVGKAGKVLRSMIGKMGFKEDEVYIANIVKCRPPGNRAPEPDEVKACIPFLKRQIEIIRPGVIMLLGNVALQNLMENPNLRITAARGKFLEYEGIRVMPTFHPSYLLRNPKDKWLTWEDAVNVLKILGRTVEHNPGGSEC